jgi:hypothetical protein
MSDEPALSKPLVEPPKPKEPIQAGQVYIGASNTRSAVMQIHLHRFQQSLTANHAGLAAVAAWLTLSDHPPLALACCLVACIYSFNLSRLWIDLIQDTVVNLNFWNEQINTMVFELGIKDHHPPRTEIVRPTPKVKPNQLYRPLKQCSVAWVVLAIITTYMLFNNEETRQWTLTLWHGLQGALRSLGS